MNPQPHPGMVMGIIPVGIKGHIGSSHALTNDVVREELTRRGISCFSSANTILASYPVEWVGLLHESGSQFPLADIIVHLFRENYCTSMTQTAGIVSGELGDSIRELFFGSVASPIPMIHKTTDAEWNYFTKHVAEVFPQSMRKLYNLRHPLARYDNEGFSKNEFATYLSEWKVDAEPHFNKIVAILGEKYHGSYHCCYQSKKTLNTSNPRFIIEDRDSLDVASSDDSRTQLLAKYCFMLTMSLPENAMEKITADDIIIPPNLLPAWRSGSLFTYERRGCDWMDPQTLCQTGNQCIILSLIHLIRDNWENNPMEGGAIPQIKLWTPTQLEVFAGLILLDFILTGNFNKDMNGLLVLGSDSGTLEYYRNTIWALLWTMLRDPASQLNANNFAKLMPLALKIEARYPEAIILQDSQKLPQENAQDQCLDLVKRMKMGTLLRADDAAKVWYWRDANILMALMTTQAQTVAETLRMSIRWDMRPAENYFSVKFGKLHKLNTLLTSRIPETKIHGAGITGFVHNHRIIGLLSFNSEPIPRIPAKCPNVINRYKSASHVVIMSDDSITDDMKQVMIERIHQTYGNGPVFLMKYHTLQSWSAFPEMSLERMQFDNMNVMYGCRFGIRTLHLTPERTLAMDVNRIMQLGNLTAGVGEQAYYTIVSTLYNEVVPQP